ncbi:TetR/AcrR family transcriptional regulator [Sphingomonas sp. RP10(2022)]|uniref:TetR/AcrR family transcriptional regulator n=1 Tax=Sphingomonas liriopis TaxID=2949094 RepID=A0A9X2KQ84_9SPHN|nr:TetR/AcrR family transcriptional regulator [Sphingomonas liriopis]MCP3735474.1 TetR/AcrR family transcriptional regulator [Sphingomonas liriopis]
MIEPGFCCSAPRNKAEARRDRVVRAARKLFIDNGFHATGIAQIARESGIAVGQLYRDFSAKEDIVAAIVSTDCRSFMAADSLRLAIGNDDSAQVRDWIHQFVMPEDDIDNSRLFAEIMAEATRNERIAAIYDVVHEDLRTLMREALEMLAPGAALAERRNAVAHTILTLSLGLLHHQLMRPQLDIVPLAQAFVVIVDREIDALRVETGAAIAE